MRLPLRTLLNGAIFALAFAGPSTAQSLNGAIAHDGDDIIFAGSDFRLQGIDAFELEQMCQDAKGAKVPCGQYAKNALAQLLHGQSVDCKPTGENAGKRIVGRCYAGSQNVEEEMVRGGWAFVRPDFAKERTSMLCQLERNAAASQLGGWALQFKRPYFFKSGKSKSFAQIACQHEHAR